MNQHAITYENDENPSLSRQRMAIIPCDSISFGRFSSKMRDYCGRPIRCATLGCVTLANRWNVCSPSLPRYESYRYPFIYGCPSDQTRSVASGIILASGVICGHLALARRLIATGAIARNSRRDLDCPTTWVSSINLRENIP